MMHRLFSRFPAGIPGCLLAVLLLGSQGAFAQTEHHTGRHKVKPAPQTIAVRRADTRAEMEPPRWNFSLAVGNRQGGDLFRLRVVNGSAVPWLGLDPGGFQTSRFTVDFEGSTSWQGSVSREFGAVWRMRANAGYVGQDVTATALVGQTGARYRFDKMDIWSLGVGIERDLVHELSAPYAGLGFTVSHLDPVVNKDLAQTAWGARVSLGYRHMIGRRTSLFMEASLEEMQLDRGGYDPQAREPFHPEFSLEFSDQMTFFALQAGLRVGIPR